MTVYFDKSTDGILKRTSGIFKIIILPATAIPTIYLSFLLYETMTIKIFGPQLLAILILASIAVGIYALLNDIIGNNDFDKLSYSEQHGGYKKNKFLSLPPYVLDNINLNWRYFSKKKRKQRIKYLYKTLFNYYWNNDKAWYSVPDFLKDKHAIKYYLKNSEVGKGLDINKEAIELVEAWIKIDKAYTCITPAKKREAYRETFPEANTIFVDYFTNKTADFLKIPVYSPFDLLKLIYYRKFRKGEYI